MDPLKPSPLNECTTPRRSLAKPMKLAVHATSILIISGLALVATGQEIPVEPAPDRVEEPPDLIQLRKTFEAELEARITPAKEAYLKELTKLEGKRALLEDYQGAIRVKRTRLAIEGTLGRNAAGEIVPGEIDLPVSRGRRSGSSLNYDTKRGALTGFEKAGHQITWDVMKVQPGPYRVLVTYGCAVETVIQERDDIKGKLRETILKTGGSFTFEEETNLSTGDDRVLRHTVFSTGSWDKIVTRNIGRINITGTRATLKLTAHEPNPGGLMALRNLRLVPYQVTAEAMSTDPLGELQAKYRAKVDELTAADFQDYIASLKALEDLLANSDRLRDALAVKAERAEVERLAARGTSAAARTIVSPTL